MITFFERTFAAGVVAAALFFATLAAVHVLAGPAAAGVARGFSTAEAVSVRGDVVHQAALSARSGKRVKGSVTIERTADGGHIVRLSDDFSLSRVPDPTIGFAQGGRYVDASEFTEVASFRGEQVYRIPADIDPAEFDGIYIWCRQFSVPLAFAELR